MVLLGNPFIILPIVIVSWYDFAQKILEISGKRKELIACKYKDINRPAKRPKFSALYNNSDIQLGHYTDALGRYIHG